MKPRRGLQRVSAVSAATALVAMSTLCGTPTAAAVEPPTIDPAALPPDGQPAPAQAMRQDGAIVPPMCGILALFFQNVKFAVE